MNFFRNLFKRLKRNERGITGTDVAAGITVIVLTMGVVTSIYINTINKYKDSVRYSNAVRIATSLMEQIESQTYVQVVNDCGTEKTITNGASLYNVKVQPGYTAVVSATKVDDVDIARDIKVEVSYKSTLQTKTVTLYGVKELEIVDEVNKPDIALVPDYNNYLAGSTKYYPVISVAGGYQITDYNDPEWYNYSDKKLALLYSTTQDCSIGQSITTVDGKIYEWVPRFGLASDNKIVYCYGTSNHQISWSAYTSNEISVYGYMIARNPSTNAITDVASYVANTFTANDGLVGVWNDIGNTSGMSGIAASKLK